MAIKAARCITISHPFMAFFTPWGSRISPLKISRDSLISFDAWSSHPQELKELIGWINLIMDAAMTKKYDLKNALTVASYSEIKPLLKDVEITNAESPDMSLAQYVYSLPELMKLKV